MALRIYIRKHAPKCLRYLDERVAKGQIQPLSKEALMDYRHCKCGWWIYGTTDNGTVFKPQALKVFSYTEADKKRRQMNAPTQPDANSDTNITVKELVGLFLEHRKGENCTEETADIYQRIGDRLIDFCHKQNPRIALARDVKREHMIRMRNEWKDSGKLGLTTVNYHMGIVSMIFIHGVTENKISKNPAKMKGLKRTAERGADVAEEKEGDEKGRTLPLDPEGGDENYRKLLDGAAPFLTGKLVVPGRKFARAKTLPVFSDDTERFLCLMELMYETGLRISDAIHFEPHKMMADDDDLASYTTKQLKTGHDVTVFIPTELAHRLAALKPVWRKYIFFDGSMPWRRFISAVCYRTIVDLGDAVGVPGARPHRFRDSFAVNRLQELTGVDQVSTMLGHQKIETTLRYYRPWVPALHDTLRTVRKRGIEYAKQHQLAAVPVRRALPFPARKSA